MRGFVTAFLSVALVVVLGNLIYALRRKRLRWGHILARPLWAERRDNPVLYWLLVGLNAGLLVTLIWALLTDPNSLLS
jgi:hypothetical protein